MTEYIINRKTKVISKYGLVRRTEAVIRQLQSIHIPPPCIILDVGTADGLMLRSLEEQTSLCHCLGIGLDIHFGRLQYAKKNIAHILQADGRSLPFRTHSTDVIILTAVLKHIANLTSLIIECHRVLRPGGLLIATDPTPLGIHFGLLLGHFTRAEILHSLSLGDTQNLFYKCGFKVTHAERFMVSPIPFHGSDAIESTLKRSHFDQLFFNQIICAECSDG